MRELFEFAEFLVASWTLANGDDRLPVSHGILDGALHELGSELPERYRNMLSFGNTRNGFRCHELADVLYCAQANCLIGWPNPSRLTATTQIEIGTARRLLKRQNVQPDLGRVFGLRLGASIERLLAADA